MPWCLVCFIVLEKQLLRSGIRFCGLCLTACPRNFRFLVVYWRRHAITASLFIFFHPDWRQPSAAMCTPSSNALFACSPGLQPNAHRSFIRCVIHVSILCQYCVILVSILCQSCQYCVNLVSILCQSCQYCHSCVIHVSILCQYCVILVSILCQSCVNLVSVLCHSCVILAGRAGLSQLADSFVSDPRQLFTEGQSVRAQVHICRD
jgi:ferredoxin